MFCWRVCGGGKSPDCVGAVVQLPARAQVIDRAAGSVYTWARVPTCRKRARVPSSRCVAYVYSRTRVVRAAVYEYYACTVAHVSAVR